MESAAPMMLMMIPALDSFFFSLFLPTIQKISPRTPEKKPMMTLQQNSRDTTPRIVPRIEVQFRSGFPSYGFTDAELRDDRGTGGNEETWSKPS